MKPGDIVRSVWEDGNGYAGGGGLGIYLGEYVTANQVTGEEYICAEVMWFYNNKITTCSFSVVEVVKEAV
jgi:hypothetical protein